MKNTIRILCLVLAVVMCAALVACKTNKTTSAPTTGAETQTGTTPAGTETPGTETSGTETPTEGPIRVVVPTTLDYEVDPEDPDSALYASVLGDFYTIYKPAREETNLSKRWTLMAIAEAKLLESGVFLPTTCQGGNYAISRAVPNTATGVLWGNDSYRYHNLLVATEFIKAEDRAAIKAQYKALKGTGTFYDWAKSFVTEKGYTLKDTYTIGYSSDPQTWDILATSQAADSEAIINCYDGLLEYDVENEQQYALAESYTVSEDGLTYTFKLRPNVAWVDSQGRKVADVKADDFVAGLQHMMDAAEGLEYLVDGIILNAGAYMAGDVTDMAEVGVKALDDLTLVYTLEAPTTFFTTMFGYGVFAPMSRSFYESKGGKFGAEYNPAAEDYTYGTTPENIAYCGPYVVSNATAENTIVFEANPLYWNKDNITIKKITWLYNNGDDVTKSYVDAKNGVIDGAGLNASTLVMARDEGLFDQFGYVSGTDATTFSAFINVDRVAFANVTDGAIPTVETAEEQARTSAAVKNAHFRRAVNFAVDRASYNAQDVGEELKLKSLLNGYTPGTFVSLPEDVVVAINGTDVTFPAGTFYGAIVQAQLDADGMAIKAFDPTADDGIGSSAGYDGWFNLESAVAEMEVALKELADAGVEVSAEKPVKLELPYLSTHDTYVNKAAVYKKSVEDAFGGKVIVVTVPCANYSEWLYAGYYTNSGDEANYDIYDLSGWGPDYGDPQTFLDTMLPDGAGYMTKCIGLY